LTSNALTSSQKRKKSETQCFTENEWVGMKHNLTLVIMTSVHRPHFKEDKILSYQLCNVFLPVTLTAGQVWQTILSDCIFHYKTIYLHARRVMK
jgi:hypothetical protein